MDSDLSGGWRYPPFEQLGPDCLIVVLFCGVVISAAIVAVINTVDIENVVNWQVNHSQNAG